ncbi:YdeI/OmpD-associated family protein [Nocardioides sp.]|uniref:YdeI/OmpD-associated family protein n=1 Tax=Nocardioides sp. TaxID=35761 RepID=UPI00286A347A|nr:YdeI/OmpD-associated family protein [Nocardioides sp.]
MTGDRIWIEFDALVEPLAWGRNVYTVIRLDASLEEAARTRRTRRVEGTVEDVAVNMGVNRADVMPDAFAYVGKGLQRRLAVGPGEVVRCRLRPADPDHVPLPPDLRDALADAGRLAAFESKPPAERRRLLQPVEEAARSETRRRRIEALVRDLAPH